MVNNNLSDDNNINFSLLCQKFKLGNIIEQPQEVKGGLLHKMYRIYTTKGSYAIKALNPQIMIRPEALKNFTISEKVASIAFKNGIPVLPALTLGGEEIQNINGQFFLIFNWLNGTVLPTTAVAPKQAQLIGSILGRIHQIDIDKCSVNINVNGYETDYFSQKDWQELLKRGEQVNLSWTQELENSLSKIANWKSLFIESNKILESNVVVSHRDLDQKNVIWNDDASPMIIDWESAGLINPTKELVETALYWGGQESGEVKKESFYAVIEGYLESGAKIKDDWYDALQCGYGGKLDWLRYNICRALGEGVNSKEEQEIGVRETILTLKSLNSFANNIDKWYRWLERIKV